LLKQILLILLNLIILSAILIAQENPKTEKEVVADTMEATANQINEMSADNELELPWNKVCPVKGNPIEDDTPTVDYDGKSYGFCCPGCDVKFAKNPEKYSKNLNEDGTKYIGR